MKLFKLLFVLIIALFALVACTPMQGSLAVQLPQELVVVIGWFVLIGLTAFSKWVGDRFGIDISDRAAEIAASVSAVIVLFINYGLGLIPAAYDGFVNALFAFLIVLLPSIGIYSLFFRNKNR